MRARVDDIITLAARIWGVTRGDLIGPKRHAIYARPRQAICLVAREYGHSFDWIGERLGGRDHTTVMHGFEQAQNYEQRLPDYARKLRRLRRLSGRLKPFIAERMLPSAPVVFFDRPRGLTQKPRNVFDNSDQMFCKQAEANDNICSASSAFAELLQAAL